MNIFDDIKNAYYDGYYDGYNNGYNAGFEAGQHDVMLEKEKHKPTLYGYNIEHLELIVRVLQEEGISPERVVEALTDIGGVVAIVKNEFEEGLRKAVEQCAM